MKNAKLRIMMLVFSLFAVAAGASGCAYGGVSTTNDGYVVVPRNDGFLFGALRTIFVCKVTQGGLTECQSNESP